MTAPDPRDYESPTQVGTSLRDAAVDPAAGDFLDPVNAGVEGEVGNPHGPYVISPGIHALGEVHPVTPGAVSSDAATQDAAEKDHLLQFHTAAGVPVVSAADPSGAAEGEEVTITGRGFAEATQVKFGASNATSFEVTSDTEIVAVMPAGSAGSAAIAVVNPVGTSATLAYTRGA